MVQELYVTCSAMRARPISATSRLGLSRSRPKPSVPRARRIGQVAPAGTASRAQCINWMRRSVGIIGCPSGTSPRTRFIHSAANTPNCCLANVCTTGTDSTTRTCREKFQVTVVLKPVSVGTELSIIQEGLPDVIPLEACYLGWQESLRNLAKLVESEINQ